MVGLDYFYLMPLSTAEALLREAACFRDGYEY